jgi:hypothetical protein
MSDLTSSVSAADWARSTSAMVITAYVPWASRSRGRHRRRGSRTHSSARGAQATFDVEVTLQAERKLSQVPGWRDFLIAAIGKLASDPAPDGVTKKLAEAGSRYEHCILAAAFPWLLVYQLVGKDRMVVIAIEIHPDQSRML